ncbi:leucine-rich repeat-containing protein 53 isoform X1 [Homo sapiens]|uniref:leucine-rich repeat-containing protein 53 isoform X1 n=1 Tax=Homo sapiens TaxID=9606 RepID=UPI0007DC708E|nr:leucine-rich repeat-containing protein 53 isoform X1 [Homo sapiens]|eukprot:XP_016858570.1 leucine-rich repeat-containing protein 53 isoform X2 [Homo sapiens]
MQLPQEFNKSKCKLMTAAPMTTRVLIITDGYLSSIESTNLSLLFNLALLSLSRNGIEDVQEDALHGLTMLRTLLLEHNQISSSSLTDHTFSKLHSLQVLVLSNNALRTLRGSWFRNTSGLTRLQLDGNQITNLTDSSFGGTNLHSLRYLDLSNNFISYIGKDAFRPLPQLQEVDLSRNRLAHMPDVFTPLKQLILLSLDKNQWSCTCDLHPLARFLRNYIKSSAHTLRNAKDLNCQPSTAAVAAAQSVLRLSETNCDSKAPNFTLVLKDRSPLLPGPDVALLTVLGFAGAVGLTCLGLVVFNWKLHQGKANEHTSENLCCRTFDEPLCAHEARNYHTKGYCNCHLTQENEIKVMSTVGSRKEMPLLQENSHQATSASESATLDGSFRNLKKKDRGVGSTLFCQDGRLLHSECSEPPGNMRAFNEAGLLTTYNPRKVQKLWNLEPGEVQPQTLQHHIIRTEDISSDIFRRRYATPASALAGESLEKRLTNESWQPPIEKEDNGLHPHRQRHFITSSSSKPCEPEEHYVQKIVQKNRSKYDDPCGLLKQSKPRYFQPNNSLICKYVPCEQFEDYMKEKKPNRRQHSKPEKEQIQINSAIEKFLMSEDNIDLSGLSTKTKKAYSPKRVIFHDPDLVEINRSMMSPKISTPWKRQKNQSNQLTKLDVKKFSNTGERNKGEKWFTNSWVLKRKRTPQSDLKGKIKGQNLKLNLHPFRKVRVHPEKSLSSLPKQCKQVLLPPKKLSKTSETEAKINTVCSADFLQQSESSNYVRLTSKRLPLKHDSKQTPYYQRNTKRAPLLSANNLRVVNQSSIESSCYSAGHIPDGNTSKLPQPTPTDAEHRHSHSQFSTEQMEDATQLESKVLSYLATTWENTGSDVLPFQHSRRATDQGTTESTEHMGQNVSKTSELNQFSLSPRNQTQLLDAHKTDSYNKEYTLDQNEALQHREQNSSHAQLENKEKTLMTKPQISHQIVENCIMDKEENDVEKKLSKTETYDSSLIPQTQSKNNLSFMKTNSIPYQNRIELPKDISTSPVSSQAVWHLTNSSEKGIDSTNALPRNDGTEALEIKIVGKEEKNMLDESKTDSSMLTQISQMTLKGITKERQQTWENGTSEKYILHDASSAEETITAKDLSITSSHETQNRILCSEVDPEVNSNVHNFREVQNIQPDKDSAHKEGAMTVETHEALSFLPGLKDSFEAENEVFLVPSRINEAENSAPKPVLYPPSAEYATTSPLETE